MPIQIKVVISPNNYGLDLSGSLGTRPELEQEYVLRFTVRGKPDGIVSLREALEDYKANGSGVAYWDAVTRAQEQLDQVKEKLLAAGYTVHDLMKLTLDNS